MNNTLKNMSDELYASFEKVKQSPLDLNNAMEHIALLTSVVDTLLANMGGLIEIMGVPDDHK